MYYFCNAQQSSFDHTFELLLPEVRHDVGVDANDSPLLTGIFHIE